MAADYAKKTNAELVEILKSRGLPHAGKKADMVARLQEDDNKQAAAPAKTDVADDVIDWEDDEVPAAVSTAAKPAEAPAPAEEKEKEAAPAAEETNGQEVQDAEASQKPAEEVATGTAEEPAAQPEEKPAPNYSIGLSVTDLEEEVKKRKARAEKFGITEESQAAIDEAERKLQRAKRFGISAAEAPSAESISRLDQALPEKSRKRGRGDNDQGARGGKRRSMNGRNNQRHRGRGNRNQNQGQRQKRGTNNAENGLSEKDKQAMEARKKRFATGA
ncbi:hypothetical protein BJX61DRAFT_531564 [Aspergillus egyptiacus]|nr:hypothetical protein BJX61DRAFT_531564 [Aspergillus egyptiacus]